MRKIEVVAAVIFENNKVFATQRGYGEFKGFWEFPGGKIENGETKMAALKREIKEELKIEIEVFELLETIEYDYEKFHLTMHCFNCKIKKGIPTLLEHQDACWVGLENIDKLNWLPADLGVIKKIKDSLKSSN